MSANILLYEGESHDNNNTKNRHRDQKCPRT